MDPDGADFTGWPVGDTAYQTPPKLFMPSPVTSPGAWSLMKVYNGQPATVAIGVPAVDLVAPTVAVTPGSLPADFGAGTAGQ